MLKFLDRFQITSELQRIISGATEYLVLISPYFKLNESIKKSLLTHVIDKKISLIVVYRKKANTESKSISKEDLNFFKSFPNVEIRHHEKLHAKIYINETSCLMTSMNLYDFSMSENIEAGIITQPDTPDPGTRSTPLINPGLSFDPLDTEISRFCEDIIDKSDLEFTTKAQKQNSFLQRGRFGNEVKGLPPADLS